MSDISIREIVDELAGRPPRWDTTVQTPEEARRMRAYILLAIADALEAYLPPA